MSQEMKNLGNYPSTLAKLKSTFGVNDVSTPNIVDPNGMVQGGYISNSNVFVPNASYQYSGFIAVTPSTIYTAIMLNPLSSAIRFIAFYDASKNLAVGGSEDAITTFTTGANVYFIRFSTLCVAAGRLTSGIGIFKGSNPIWKPYLGSTTNQVTIENSDKIVFFGDSYIEQIQTLKGKGILSYLSMFSDWNFENYAASGNGYAEILARVKSDTASFHPDYGITKYNGTYAFLASFTNDRNNGAITEANQLNVYLANLKLLIQAVKGLGMIPVICTEYHNYSGAPSVGDLLQSSLSDIAYEYGCLFADILTKTKRLKNGAYAPFWSTSHPGIRTNVVIWDNLKPYIESLPRPRNGIKIFRKRTSFTIATTADLLCQDNLMRAKAFKEINVSQKALLDADAKYFDDLTAWTALAHTAQTVYEYFDIRKGTAIAFDDYALIEVIIPTTPKNLQSFSLALSNSAVSVWVKDLVNNTWVSLTNRGGLVELTTFMKYFNVDKVSFLIYKSGGFTLNNCVALWSGAEKKDYQIGVKPLLKELATTELLAVTTVNDLTNWTVTGTVTPADPFDSDLPISLTKMVELTTANYLSQAVSYSAETIRKRKLQVKLWVRYLPAQFASTDTYPTNSWTNEDKYDLAEISIQLKKDVNNIVTKLHYVGLHWHEILFEVDVPLNETGFDLVLKSNTAKPIQLAYASVKIES